VWRGLLEALYVNTKTPTIITTTSMKKAKSSPRTPASQKYPLKFFFRTTRGTEKETLAGVTVAKGEKKMTGRVSGSKTAGKNRYLYSRELYKRSRKKKALPFRGAAAAVRRGPTRQSTILLERNGPLKVDALQRLRGPRVE